jgi:hypothetical protein
MSQKTSAVIIIILLMGFGFLAGSFFGGFFGQLTVPASHKTIIIDLTIAAYGSSVLTPTYLTTGKSTWQLSTLQENFEWHGTYTYSLWVYSFEGDPEVYVCIWGPGKDGKTYSVELSSAAHGRGYTYQRGSGSAVTWSDNTNFPVEVD